MVDSSHPQALNKVLTQHYELLEEIGSGGSGRVFKARHRAMNQIVAIKVLSSNENDRVTQKRFEQEAKIISSLEHPGIVRVRDFGAAESTQLYMVLDFVPGQSIAQMLVWQEKLEPFEAYDVILQVCDAMQYAHERGIFHRDLKPANIMLERNNGKLKITILDFGIAKLSTSSELRNAALTRTNEVLGSLTYLSPEQASERTSDARSDVYSLGIVLFELLTGKPPFLSTNAIAMVNEHLSAPIPSLNTASINVSPQIQNVVEKALAKKPQDRFQSMAEFKHELLEAIYGKEKSLAAIKKPGVAKNSKIFLASALTLLCIAFATAVALDITRHPAVNKPTALQSNQARPEPRPGLSNNEDATKIIEENRDSKSIDFRGLGLSDEALRSFENCSKTEEINLRGSRVTGPGLAYLIHLPLRKLDLYDSPMDDRGIAEIGNMRDLESLNLSYTQITDKGLHHLEKLQKLKRLSLKECSVSDQGIEAISKLKNLECLNLKKNQLMTKKGFELLAAMPALRELRMRSTLLDQPISGLEASKNLKVLDLRDSKLSDSTLKHLLGTNIERLNIGHAKVSAEGLPMVAKMSKLKFLRPGRDADKIALAKLLKLRPEIDTETKIGEDTDDF